MSKKESIVSMAINLVLVFIGALVTIKFGIDAEFGVKTILMDLQYNVPWDVIIRQSFMPDFLMSVIVTGFCLIATYEYAGKVFDAAQRLINRSKEERDAEQFIKWMKKEQKRLRKLERTC